LDRQSRRTIVIGLAIAAMVVASLVYLGASKTSIPTAARPSSTPSGFATPVPSPANLSCSPTELKLTGIYNECATVDKGQSCSASSPDPLWFVLLRGTKHQFLLYVELYGIYRGSGTYALTPWPHSTFGVADGVPKVAVREYVTGALWQSSAGSLTVDSSENGGWVYAGLGASSNSPVQVDLNIAGWWSCS
jgi:hypothetical protein